MDQNTSLLLVLCVALIMGLVISQRYFSTGSPTVPLVRPGGGKTLQTGKTGGAKSMSLYDPGSAGDAAYVPWTGDRLAGIKSVGSRHIVTDTQDPSTLGIVRHNHLFASKRSRLRALADPIRGDLPIVPETGDWKPSVKPHVDLHPGSLNVVAGYNNALSQQMAHLVHVSSGGTERQIGGISF